MNPCALVARGRWPSGAVIAALLCVSLSSSGFALPRGYKEDFNGCARTEDKADRKRCCDETWEDCANECKRLYPTSDEYFGCASLCLSAMESCRDGKQVRLIQWPGRPGLELPSVMDDRNTIVANPGVRFHLSDNIAVIEMQSPEAKSPAERCLAIVAMCPRPQSPKEQTGSTATYRLTVNGDRLECQSCTKTSDGEKCTPCLDCAPEVLSVVVCSPPDQAASPKATGKD